MAQQEQWKIVNGTGGVLQISSLGRVMSLLRGQKILKPTPDEKGYLRVRVDINGRPQTFNVHRMVAEAFIPNPNNLPQINHKDGNKNNNSVDNLEWISNIDNAHHAIATGLWDNIFKPKGGNYG